MIFALNGQNIRWMGEQVTGEGHEPRLRKHIILELSAFFRAMWKIGNARLPRDHTVECIALYKPNKNN